MTFDVVTVHQRVVSKRVVDFDRRSFEQGSLAVLVGSAGHSMASMLPASSTYAAAERDRRA